MTVTAYLVTYEPIDGVVNDDDLSEPPRLVSLDTARPPGRFLVTSVDERAHLLKEKVQEVIVKLGHDPGVDPAAIRVWALTNIRVEEHRELRITGDVL